MHFFKNNAKLSPYFQLTTIEIKWKYEIDDEDIQKLGEEFSKLTKSKVELIALEI